MTQSTRGCGVIVLCWRELGTRLLCYAISRLVFYTLMYERLNTDAILVHDLERAIFATSCDCKLESTDIEMLMYYIAPHAARSLFLAHHRCISLNRHLSPRILDHSSPSPQTSSTNPQKPLMAQPRHLACPFLQEQERCR